MTNLTQTRRTMRFGVILLAVFFIGFGLTWQSESPAADRDSRGSVRVTDASLVISHDGKTDFVVVGAHNATEAESMAAKELAEYLGKVTGAEFPLVVENKAPRASRKIYVGWTDFAARRSADGSTLGEEEWIIRTVGRDLVIIGGRSRGTLYGVYEFLERELGCHWLDESTEVVPKIPNLKLGEVNRRGQPAFWTRAISGGYYSIDSGLYTKDQAYRARNKVNGRASGSLPAKFGFEVCYGSPKRCHTFASYAKDFPPEHPEYLSMNAKGERIGATSGNGPGGICLTHPEVRRLVLARLKKFIARDRSTAARGNYLKLEHGCDGTKLSAPEEAWLGDQWELFFAAQREPPCRQLVVNAGGKVVENEWPYLYNTPFKGKWNRQAWTAGARVMSSPEEDGWTVYISVPLKNIVPDGIEKSDVFYASICRCIPHHEQTKSPRGSRHESSFLLTPLTQLVLK